MGTRSAECAGQASADNDCLSECPSWSEWSPWSQCSQTCSDGSDGAQNRNRVCTNGNGDDLYGSCLPDENAQSQECGSNTCPISTTSTVTTLTATTVIATTTETTTLTTTPTTTTISDTNEETTTETTTTTETITPTTSQITVTARTTTPLADIVILWTDWSEWSDCSRTCGKSEAKSRNRQCLNDEAVVNSSECPGEENEVVNCSDLPDCSLTCDDVKCIDPHSSCMLVSQGPTCACDYPWKYDNTTEMCSTCYALRPFAWMCKGTHVILIKQDCRFLQKLYHEQLMINCPYCFNIRRLVH